MVTHTLHPALGCLRFATKEDAPLILQMVNESMAKNFRINNSSDIVYLIDNSVLSICQLDVNETIVGFLSAKDYPLLPSVHPMAWEEYIWTKYKAIELTSRNTLFIHLLCWNLDYSREVVDSLLKSMFMHDPYLHYICMTKNLSSYPLLMPGHSRSEASFRRVQATERGVPADVMPTLHIADRSTVSPRLRIRRAVEEDNDDLVPIIERHSPRLREMYGEFYISELISRHPESDRILLVCEHNELAVGVMSLNIMINFEVLEECFELAPFGGLRQLERWPAKIKHGLDVESNMSISVTKLESMTQSINVHQGNTSLREEPKVKNKTQFKERALSKSRLHGRSTTSLPTSSVHVLSLLEEDDELDFDIVNIDTYLLRVPAVLTYEGQEEGLAADIMKVLDNTARYEDTTTKKEKHKLNYERAVLLRPVRRYTGSPNAFLLEIFAMNEEYDERYGFDMLEAAYELFPDRDYCIMCLPSTHPPFPLLEHFTLVTPYVGRTRFINDSLYVAHINSVRGEVRVRRGEASDLDALRDVLQHAPRAVDLIDLFNTSLASPALNSFVLLSQKQPVGVVILGPLQDGTAIRTQYALEPEPRRARTDAAILAGVLSPALEPHSRWYMRELLRLSHYTTLFWISRLFAKGDSSPSRNLMSLAGHMTPMSPRLSVPNISGLKELDNIFQDLATPFALWAIERPMTSMPRVFVNNGIVVVGASRTGLAFLETLILGPTSEYVTFSNLSLVSTNGLPVAVECLCAAATSVPRPGRYSDRHIKSVPFHFYVDEVAATLDRIDRKSKCIHLKDGTVKFYDELVLTCGLQFQHPEYMQKTFKQENEIKNGNLCDRLLMDDPKYQPDKVPPSPVGFENLMLINSVFAANTCFRKLLRMVNSENEMILSEYNPVVVYGACVEAYNCIAGLLELGLSPETITFVEPFPPEDAKLRVNCFNDDTVDGRVQRSLSDLHVRILRGYTFDGWTISGARIEAINLISSMYAISQACFAFFYYGRKAIDIDAFKAINESGLVYDGGLIIDSEFKTNDQHVYAAGSCTQYSRRLRADRWRHRYFYSEDVGEALARIFLRRLNPFVTPESVAHTDNSTLLTRYNSSLVTLENPNKTTPVSSPVRLSRAGGNSSLGWQPVLKFQSPIVHYSVLPGPLYYLKVRKPGREIPMEVQMSLPLQGHTLVTDKNGDYFCLKLNALHCVEAVTCLSKKTFSVQIIMQLYGKHEALFHQLLYRFQRQEIDDLYEYFTQPWMLALYLEPFNDLLDHIKQQDVVTECGNSACLRDCVEELWRSVDGEQRAMCLLSRYLCLYSGTHKFYAPPPADI
ncbi:hypothetical protein ACJJTC_009443 [Scirpophaga incertulas]